MKNLKMLQMLLLLTTVVHAQQLKPVNQRLRPG